MLEKITIASCLAGEILQKFINYTSKPLKDFMYGSNNGKDIYFQPTVKLAAILV